MRKKVKLSAWCTIMTLIGLIVLLAAFYLAKDSLAKYIVVGALFVLCFTALCYMPLSISVRDGELNINRPLKIKSIPLSTIDSVKLVSPTMAEKRICGSGGWFGYYGWFSEPSIGKYFAYLRLFSCHIERREKVYTRMRKSQRYGGLYQRIN